MRGRVGTGAGLAIAIAVRSVMWRHQESLRFCSRGNFPRACPPGIRAWQRQLVETSSAKGTHDQMQAQQEAARLGLGLAPRTSIGDVRDVALGHLELVNPWEGVGEPHKAVVAVGGVELPLAIDDRLTADSVPEAIHGSSAAARDSRERAAGADVYGRFRTNRIRVGGVLPSPWHRGRAC